MKTIISLIFTFFALSSFAQKTVDTTFAFQSDPAKKLSLYIPSSYVPGTNNALMVGLHPFNVRRWNAKSWRDTLISFAESNQLILLCPDGGRDGQIDDQIDTAFASAMIDSAKKWYSIDNKRVYCMGFSWGGKTTYTYGLSNPDVFCGYLPYGAVVNTREVSPIAQNINNKPIYILHGQNDLPNTSYTPLKTLMENNGGLVRGKLLPRVGHTVDFQNRNSEFTIGYKYLDSVCNKPISTPLIESFQSNNEFHIYPNPAKRNEMVSLELNKPEDFEILQVFDMNGKLVETQAIFNSSIEIQLKTPGYYTLILKGTNESLRTRLLVN
jgi:predicted esterase